MRNKEILNVFNDAGFNVNVNCPYSLNEKLRDITLNELNDIMLYLPNTMPTFKETPFPHVEIDNGAYRIVLYDYDKGWNSDLYAFSNISIRCVFPSSANITNSIVENYNKVSSFSKMFRNGEEAFVAMAVSVSGEKVSNLLNQVVSIINECEAIIESAQGDY